MHSYALWYTKCTTGQYTRTFWYMKCTIVHVSFDTVYWHCWLHTYSCKFFTSSIQQQDLSFKQRVQIEMIFSYATVLNFWYRGTCNNNLNCACCSLVGQKRDWFNKGLKWLLAVWNCLACSLYKCNVSQFFSFSLFYLFWCSLFSIISRYFKHLSKYK